MGRAIVLENLDDASAIWIEQEAERRGLSVEQVALELIQQAIKAAQLKTYHDLDDLAGTWSDEEADEFLSVIADFERVDEKLWQ
jgi:DNA polymerase III delta subunit